MDIRNKVIEILKTGHLMSLGTIDGGGVWVADVIYIHDDDLNIYWMSDPECRHSKAISENSKVAGTITTSNKSKEPNLGIQIGGMAEKIDGKRFDLVIKHLAKRGYKIPKNPIDILEGDSWYKLIPTKIELTDEEHFGFDKHELKVL